MFVGAFNKCPWVNTRKPGVCGKKCVGSFCAFHNHLVNKKERPLAKPCEKCQINATKSITGLCQSCGASKITSELWRQNKKNSLIQQ